MIRKWIALSAACLMTISLCSCYHPEDVAGAGEAAASQTENSLGGESSTTAPAESTTVPVESDAGQEEPEDSTTLPAADDTTAPPTKETTTTTTQTQTQTTTTASDRYDLDKPLVFDDPLVEKMVREFICKPEGEVYPRDFSDFFGDLPRYFGVEYDERNNKTCLVDVIGPGRLGECQGKPSSFKALSTIPFKYIKFDNISDIRDLCPETLEDVRIFSCDHLENLDSLANCKNLDSVYIQNCQGLDLSALSGLQNITVVTIEESEASGFDVLASFPKLKYLGIRDTTFTDLSPLRHHPSVEDLDFDYKPGMDLSVLLEMPNLKELAIHDLEPVGYSIPFPSETIYQALIQKGVTVETWANGWRYVWP